MVEAMPEWHETNIFEGSQGLLLSQDIGFFPHVTRSNTGTKNVTEMVGHNTSDIYLVTRAYQTRHGNGPMTNNALEDSFIREDPDETNVYHQFQGIFRKSALDLDLIRYGILKDGGIKEASLVITCLDHLDKFMLTSNGKMHIFPSEDDFIRNIVDTLSDVIRINEVLLSRAPYSDKITKFNGKEAE
jgi:adenylosuccinate synthase